MKQEYHEGKDAHENFTKLAIALFGAPKATVKPAKKAARTPKKTSKG